MYPKSLWQAVVWLVFCVTACGTALAQNAAVTGLVTSAEEGLEPLD